MFPCVCISHIPPQDDYDLTVNLNMNSSNRISANIIALWSRNLLFSVIHGKLRFFCLNESVCTDVVF